MDEEQKIRMKPFDIDPYLLGKGERPQSDPKIREITAGLQERIMQICEDPELWSLCCIQGCCVSWCCVQFH